MAISVLKKIAKKKEIKVKKSENHLYYSFKIEILFFMIFWKCLWLTFTKTFLPRFLL